jgi:arsenate reductase-like glutaredoxin family protein
MAEEVTGEQVEGQVTQTEPTMDIEARFAEIEKRFKAEISGLNRKNSELVKELDEEKKAKMTEAERLQLEKKQAEAKAAELEEKLTAFETEQMITAGLAENKIPLAVKALMKKPGTQEELTKWVKAFSTAVESEVERRVTERLTKSKAPQSSAEPRSFKPLENFEDGKKASDSDFLAYLGQAIGD